MSKCGFLEVMDGGNVRGEFLSWSFPRINLALRANTQPQNDKSPTHEVIAKNPHGAWVVIGAAWKNKIKQGEKTGLDCYSLQLEEPTLFERPVKLSAFPSQPDGLRFALEYDRGAKSGEVEQGQTQVA